MLTGYSKSPGVFQVSCRIEDVQTQAVVDTGASASIVRKEFLSQLSGRMKKSCSFPTLMLTANGQPLKVEGKVSLLVEIDHFLLPHDFWVVSDLLPPVILGMDLLQNSPFVLDPEKHALIKKVKSVSDENRQLRKVPVFAVYDVEIPSTQEVCFPVAVKGIPSGSLGLLQQSDRFEGTKVAHSVNLLTNGRTAIRMLNPTQSNVVIRKNQIVADFVEVDDVEICAFSGHETDTAESAVRNTDIDFSCFDIDETFLTPAQVQQVKDLLRKNLALFPPDGAPLGRAKGVEHRINTGDALPVKSPLRRLSPQDREVLGKEIDSMLAKQVIKPSFSPWASPVVMVKKKDQTYRVCLDFRRLNDITRKDSYPIPRMDDSLDSLGGAKYFSTLDLASGYWQIPVTPEDVPKTAFNTPFGLFECLTMPFGLCNGPATFQRTMDQVLGSLRWDICLVYLDDIIVFSSNFESHLERLQTVFSRLKEAGLTLKARKCHFFKRQVEYLGHIVSEEGVAPDPAKVEAVQGFPLPSNVKELRRFLGKIGYYRRFIKNFSLVAAPLHHMIQAGVKFHWSDEALEAFQTLKDRMMSSVILAFPRFDLPFILETDASAIGVGALLSQEVNNVERPICFASQKLSKSEQNYSVIQREILAARWALQQFRPYLLGRHFILKTDHNPLVYLRQQKHLKPTLARWALEFEEFTFEFQHRPGKENERADALSRAPVREPPVDTENSHMFLDQFQEKKIGARTAENREIHPQQEHVSGAVTSDRYRPEIIGFLDFSNPDNLREWVDEQLGDVYLGLLIRMIKNSEQGQALPEYTSIEDDSLKTYLTLWKKGQLILKSGLLYRITEEGLEILVPKSKVPHILSSFHNHQTAGHLGVKKTRDRLRNCAYWVGIDTDVADWIRSCTECQLKQRASPIPSAPLQPIQHAERPFQMMAADILSGLPETPSGNKVILVVSDYFTRWIEAFPLPDEKAETIARKLVDEIFLRFGLPEQFHTDQGRQFEGTLMAEICRLLGVRKTATAIYHPQSDGLVERFNRTLLSMLRSYVVDCPEKWDTWLPTLLFAYRTSVQQSLRKSPYEVMFGIKPRTPIEFDVLPGFRQPFAGELAHTLQEMRQRVLGNLRTAQERQKIHYDARQKFMSAWEEGDLVWVGLGKAPKGKFLKLCTKYEAIPYRIISVRPQTVKVENLATRAQKVVPYNRLKRFVARPHRLEISEHNDSSDSEEDDDIDISPMIDSENIEDSEDDVDHRESETPENLRRSQRTRRPPERYGDPFPYW